MANGRTPLTAANLQDALGNPLLAGTLQIVPTDGNDQPITAVSGQTAVTGAGAQPAGGAIMISGENPAYIPITSGALPATASVADTRVTRPANISYRLTVLDASGTPIYTLTGVQSPQDGSAINLDTWLPNVASQAIVQYGPQGPAGTVAIGSVTNVAAGSSPSVTNSGTAANAVLNFTLPQGATGPAGTTTLTGSSGSFAIPDAAFVKSYLIGLFASDDAFGDSITAGSGASVYANCWVSRVAARLGLTATNHGVVGTGAAEQPQYIYPLSISDSGYQLFSLAVGLNDASKYYTDAANARNFQGFHLASAAGLAVSSSRKITGQGSGSTRTGTWTNNSYYGGAMGVQSQTHGDTVSFSASGPAVYVAMTWDVGNPAAYSISIDGTVVGTFSSGGFTDGASGGFTTNLGGTYGSFLHRFAGLADGTHAVVITVTSATSAGYVKFDWGAGLLRNNHHTGGPTLVVGGVTYTNSGGLPQSLADTYSAYIKSNVLALAGDGLNVFYADSPSFVNPQTDLSSDNIHPNDTGHSRMADGFLSALHSATDAPSKAAALFIAEIVRHAAITGDTGLTLQSLSSGGQAGDYPLNLFNKRSAGGANATTTLNFLSSDNAGGSPIGVQLQQQLVSNGAGATSSRFVISTTAGGVLARRIFVDETGAVSFSSDVGVVFQSATQADTAGDYTTHFRNQRRSGGGNTTTTIALESDDAALGVAVGAQIQSRLYANGPGATSSRLGIMTTSGGATADRILIDEFGVTSITNDAGPVFQSATSGGTSGDHTTHFRNQRSAGGATSTTTLALENNLGGTITPAALIQSRLLSNTPGSSTSRLGLMTTVSGSTADRVLIDESGNTNVLGKLVASGGLNRPLAGVPTATSAGTAGDIVWSDAYIYVCVATNSWKRVALTADTW